MSGKNKEKKEKGLVQRRLEPTALAPTPFFGPTPFNMMRRFMDDIDRLFEGFNGIQPFPFKTMESFLPEWSQIEKTMWSPQIEILKNDHTMTIRADLPGLKPEDVDVELVEGMLNLSGERKQETEEEKDGFYRSERSYGSFFRSIPLPDGVKPEDATAKFENGVLEVKLAIPLPEKRGKIEITTAEPEPPKAVAAGT